MDVHAIHLHVHPLLTEAPHIVNKPDTVTTETRSKRMTITMAFPPAVLELYNPPSILHHGNRPALDGGRSRESSRPYRAQDAVR
jgi:hypothetical protein